MIVPIVEKKSDAISCGSYRGVKLLERAMKIVERILERRIRIIINLNKTKFGFMPGTSRMDVISNVRMMQEEYQSTKKEVFICVLFT